MRNIVLVGFMGTGKTTIARALAKKFNMKYVSTDEFIEEKEKLSIPEIFAKKGERHFRKIERDAVKSASSLKNAVIDAGGGVVMDPENMKNLKKQGVVVCLWADPEVILGRTKGRGYRPLLLVKNPLAKINELLAKRKPFYEKADYHVRASWVPPGEIVRKIERIVKNVRKK